MKKILISVIAAVSLNTMTAQAGTEDKLVEVCKASTGESLASFKRAVKGTSMRLRDLYPTLKCNGIELLGFSIKTGDNSISEYIINRTKRRDLTTIEGVKSKEWFIRNGYEDTKTYEILVDKLG